jgi:GTP-binding protein EngB required for normal cell division
MNQYQEVDELRQYTLFKQEVGELLRSIKHSFKEHNLSSGEEEIQGLLVKLAEDRFNLAVVGQFKRGKSTLMNAIIGRDLLPTGLLPLTSAITTLRYGPQEKVFLKRKNWVLEQEIPLSTLAEYVTEQGNPGNEKGLVEARIELPIQFLRRGLHFIDTPGIGSTQEKNSLTTYEFIPEADAVIFVTSVEAPLSKTEEDFLREIRQYVRKLFIIVNKMDLILPIERQPILDYIQKGLQGVLGQEPFRLFPLSARQSLEAKRSSNFRLLKESGLEEFEEVLTTFLSQDKESTFLISILDQSARVVEEQTQQENVDIPASIAGRLSDLRNQIMQKEPADVVDHATLPETGSPEVLEQVIMTSLDEQNRTNGQAIFKTGTCPICAAQSQAVFDFFAQWQYRLVTVEQARQEFVAMMGFCPVHTWQFAQIASPQGISEVYPALIERILSHLQAANGQHNHNLKADSQPLQPEERTCPACRVVQEAGETALHTFLNELSSETGRHSYQKTIGLCIAHFQAASKMTDQKEIAEFLLLEQLRHLEELSEDMHSYVLKREALRRGLLSDDERKAWQRALVQLYSEPTAYSR